MREVKFRAWNGHNIELPVYDVSKQYGSSKGKPYILMQYTGLIDANHKEVYENDILRVTNPFTKKSVIKSVWWNGETARFNGIPTSLTNVFEVIGNIYENPELLKKGEQS